MTNCKFCKYRSWDGDYCGKGLQVGVNDCNQYKAGPHASSPPPALSWVFPPPSSTRGCFIPINNVTDRYELHLPRGQSIWPGYSSRSIDAVGQMGIFMYQNPLLLDLIRNECLFDDDYTGKSYTCNQIGVNCTDRRGQTCEGFTKPTSRGISLLVNVSRFEVTLSICLTYCKGKHNSLPWHNNFENDMPEEYWWLDVTAPMDYLIPMHALIRAVYTATNTPTEWKTMGRVLKEALSLGVLLRGRPLNVWHEAIGGLNICMYREDLTTNDRRILFHWEHDDQIFGESYD